MRKKVSLRTIAKRNPQVDVRQVHEGIKLFEKLRKEGLVPAKDRSRMAIPGVYARPTDHTLEEDPRTIHLRQD